MSRLLIVALLVVVAHHGLTGEAPLVVSGVKVVSDKVPDVSSIDAWQASIIRPGMSDPEKAKAAYDSIVAFSHFDPPAVEFAALDSPNERDAIKLFNVYGYGSDATSTSALQLWRHLGFNARGWTVNKWGCVPEVEYDGGWHAMDPTMIAWFRRPDGQIASVAELAEGVQAWLAEHPGMKGDIDRIRAFLKDEGVAKGPVILRDGALDARGSFAFNYFGWYTAMLLYDGTNKTPFRYEEAYDQGYRVNNQLRPGEKLTLRWSNSGKHVNMDGVGGTPETLGATVGQGALYYTPQHGDMANGRVGNGTATWTVPLDKRFPALVLRADQIAADKGTLKATGANGVVELRRTTSYVFLGGTIAFDATLAKGGGIVAAMSTDHGRAWRDIGSVTADGAAAIAIPSLRRYDYRLRLTLSGAGTALRGLTISDDIQHSQRALPALGQGDNAISFSAGPDEGSLSIAPCSPAANGAGATASDLGIVLDGFQAQSDWGPWIPQGGAATATIPVETPGDLVRLRFGANYRAGLANEAWHYEVSFDDGATWIAAGRAAGPHRQNGVFVTFDAVPAGTRRALVRLRGEARGSLLIFRLRVDADYREPRGGFAPVRVTYVWSEAGKERRDEHVAAKAAETWTIRCAEKPTMGELILERADAP
ncbi:MAG TPA: hypothetical protein VEL07_05160 [Planctomycetota bacterium]|nr:hypothetical protein [Planctomycetota bacterium]